MSILVTADSLVIKAAENPFRRYLDYLYELHELSEEEEALYSGIGREFLNVIETTDMQKVYKIPILYSFYNHGNVRLEVTDEDVLYSWKEFFDAGTNWRDFAENISYDDYKRMSDKQHLNKAKTMPIRYLKASGKGFFIEKDGCALAIREDLREAINNSSFAKHLQGILEYRTMEYYRRRYENG